MHTVFKTAAIAGLAIAATAAAPAAAVTNFAAFTPIGSARNLRWVGSAANATFYSTATATATVAGARNVNFSFLQPGIAVHVPQQTASFLMNGTVTNTIATVSGTTLTQTNVNGSFSFTSTQAITIGAVTYAAGSNLLSGTFTSAKIAGTRNFSTASFTGPSASITYTSDFLTFVNGATYDFALGLASINPLFNATTAANTVVGTPNKALRSFRALIGGDFSASQAPLTPAVPEPASWMMLISGFALVGLAGRRRRTGIAA